jgi:hypothetical protein
MPQGYGAAADELVGSGAARVEGDRLVYLPPVQLIASASSSLPFGAASGAGSGTASAQDRNRLEYRTGHLGTDLAETGHGSFVWGHETTEASFSGPAGIGGPPGALGPTVQRLMSAPGRDGSSTSAGSLVASSHAGSLAPAPGGEKPRRGAGGDPFAGMHMQEVASRIYPYISARIKSELRLERERNGVLTPWHR